MGNLTYSTRTRAHSNILDKDTTMDENVWKKDKVHYTYKPLKIYMCANERYNAIYIPREDNNTTEGPTHTLDNSVAHFIIGQYTLICLYGG